MQDIWQEMAGMTQYLEENSAFLNEQLEARQGISEHLKWYLWLSTYLTQPGIHLFSLAKWKLLGNLKDISA